MVSARGDELTQTQQRIDKAADDPTRKRRNVTPADLKLIHGYRDQGYSQADVARLTGRHIATIQKHWRDKKKTPEYEIPDPNRLSPEAQKALSDFAYFRQRYFGRVSRPWHSEAANKIVELLATPTKEYLVINCPPGTGKTTLLNDIVCWVLVRDRAKRVLMGSAAENTAADNTNRVMNDLTRPDVYQATDTELAYGVAVDGVATLEGDYGRFKPANGARWTKEKFFIAQHHGRTVQEKEPSVVAFGRDSTFLGGRFNLCIWDDLVSEKNHRGEDSRDKLIRWWNNVAETRIEPGGLHVLCGQRLYPDDLYRYCIDLPAGIEDVTDDGNYPRKYHHIVFPAHDDDNCNNLHDIDSPAQGDGGCLLDPFRLPWRELRTIQANPLSDYATVYQQQDGDDKTALVQRVWVDGGVQDMTTYPGCLDRDRDLWQLDGVYDTVQAITIDPSPSQFWAVQCWAYSPRDDLRFLLALERSKMAASQVLDYDIRTRQYRGLLNDWVQTARAIGRPIQRVVVENNAAQKFIAQYTFFRDWASQNNLLIIEHSTVTQNKNSTSFGVQTLGPLWMHGKVRLPYATHSAKVASNHLIKEVTHWPHLATEDQVMAHWFFEFNLDRISRTNAKVYEIPGHRLKYVGTRTA